jgi:hypothetical protein
MCELGILREWQEVVSQDVKQPERDAINRPALSVEVTNAWSHIVTAAVFACSLIKLSENLLPRFGFYTDPGAHTGSGPYPRSDNDHVLRGKAAS